MESNHDLLVFSEARTPGTPGGQSFGTEGSNLDWAGQSRTCCHYTSPEQPGREACYSGLV